MTPNPSSTFTVNDRTYKVPSQPVAVFCLDGTSDEYIDAALARGLAPNLQKIIVQGYRGLARSALPSFTNVNNASIVTGVPPSGHGISGNFFLDPESGEEVMMNSAHYLRAPTLLAAAAQAGRKVAMVTAKEKLRDILSHGLKGMAFSAEKAGQAALETHGIEHVEKHVGLPTPKVYSADASLFVLQAGIALLESRQADFFYLSLTDYIQHKFAPAEKGALDFMAGIDDKVGRMLELGAVLGLTADHGMNTKETEAGEPNVIYLQTLLEEKFGKGFRVILPITDPYVVHHGALGSFAVVHMPRPDLLEPVRQWLMDMDEVTEVCDRETAVRKLELPGDRIGDLVVMSRRHVTLGRTPEHHDLSVLDGSLRSHGGRYEEMVPFIFSKPLNEVYARKAAGDPRNFDVFDFVLNGCLD